MRSKESFEQELAYLGKDLVLDSDSIHALVCLEKVRMEDGIGDLDLLADLRAIRSQMAEEEGRSLD